MRPLLLTFALALLLPVALPARAEPVPEPVPVQQTQLQEGDLLFVTAGSSGLSGAIDEATRRADAPSFDHVALVARDASGLHLLHADSEGSREQPLSAFMADAGGKGRQVHVYRLKPPQRRAIADAIAKARTLLGKPYNHSYVQSEDSYYCSDFIERAFRAHQVFQTQPMNFRNKETGQFPAHWVAFYGSRGMPVPQGEPGTNPNDMAAAPVLEYVGLLR